GGDHRYGVSRGRGGAEIAADRRPVSDLRRADRARRLDERTEVGEVANDLRERHAGADEDGAVLPPAFPELRDAGEVEQRRRTQPAEVDRDHEVGSARDRHGLRVRRTRFQGLLECPRREVCHTATVAKASIIAGTSSPSGYSTGQVHPASTYSCTLARHSPAVPEAVISCTTSSGTRCIAFWICSSVAGHVRTEPISSSSSGATPLAFMMCGCWPRYCVTSSRARSSASERFASREQTTSCGRSTSSRLRPARSAPIARCSIASSLYAGPTR